MEMQTHFFFAIKLPDEIKAIMKSHLAELREIFPFKSWVHYEDLHITLAFLGVAPPDKLKRAETYVAERLAEAKTFKLKIQQLGIFGKYDCPRIFFADTEESNELQLIRQKVFTACEEADFQLETRPFRPHITIGRKWAGEKPFQKERLEVWQRLQPKPLEFEVSEIALYQTHLHKIPKYAAIKQFFLYGNK